MYMYIYIHLYNSVLNVDSVHPNEMCPCPRLILISICVCLTLLISEYNYRCYGNVGNLIGKISVYTSLS